MIGIQSVRIDASISWKYIINCKILSQIPPPISFAQNVYNF